MSTKKFIFVIGEDIVGDLLVPGTDKFLPLQEALITGINIIEVTPETEISIGDIYIAESSN